jgi:hypothetical protein
MGTWVPRYTNLGAPLLNFLLLLSSHIVLPLSPCPPTSQLVDLEVGKQNAMSTGLAAAKGGKTQAGLHGS